MSGQSNPLNPTFRGHIASTLDALILFEACLSGELNHVPRRPHDRERQDLIQSGYIFIYEEHASGIKRWTDGVSWSPSRILGNFLIYRELEAPFPPGEKKRALKKKKPPAGGVGKSVLPSRSSVNGFALASMDASPARDTERALVGSLVDSYPFKKDGLVKKTISITHQGVPHHMVSYYNVSDVVSGRLTAPSRHPSTRNIIPRTELIMSQNFRSPIDEIEYGPEERGGPPAMFTALPNAHDFGNGPDNMLQRAMTLPSFTHMPAPHPYGASSYGFNTHHNYTTAMSQPLSSPIQPPPHMHHSASSLQTSDSTPMPPTSNGLSYATNQQGNYSLDPEKAVVRFGADSSLAHTFPRNMPTHHTSRRSSIYDVSQPTDLSSLALGHSVADGRQISNSNAYMRQPSFYLPSHSSSLADPDNSVYSHHLPIKADTNLSLPPMGGSQNYGPDGNNSAWVFEGIDNPQGQQYFGTQASENISSWHEGENGVGRS